MILLSLAMITLGAGIFVALHNLSISHRQIAMNLRRAGSYAIVNTHEKELSRSASERLIMPMLSRFSDIAMRMSPAGKRIELRRKIQNAGVKVTPQNILAFKGIFVFAAIAVFFIGAGIGSLPVIVGGLGLFLIGFIGPDFWLNSKVRSRREAMERALPDTLDLLTVSVEAGLGFDSAISKVCEKMDGPLIDEFDMMAREVRVGESRRKALRNMGERVDSDDIRSFTRAIIQADELGTSLGRTLKVQADDMRVHRQLTAEEKAMKAPVKILFPTVLFIFPAMFIVILGPAMLSILEAFKST